MKKFTFILAIFIGSTSFSQNIFYDDFSTFNLAKLDSQGSYTSASPTAGNGTGTCTNFGCNVKIALKSITYPNFGSCTQALNPIDGILATGDGPGKSLGTPVTSGAIYVAMIVNFLEPNTGGNMTSNKQVVRLMDNSFASATRLYYKRAAAGAFQIGVDKNGSAASFSSNTYSYGQDHLMILKYKFNTASNSDDITAVFIDPDMSLPEPTPTVSVNGFTDATVINRIAFPWNSTSNIPNGHIGIVSVAQSWATIVPTISTIDISGNIKSAGGLTVSGAKLKLKSMTNTDSTTTNAGAYIFPNVGPNIFVIKASKNNDLVKSNGVKSTDVLTVQRHILSTARLTNPYKLIAADVNGDKLINSTDVLRMKRLILATDTTFGSTLRGNRLWEFIDSAYVFPDTTNPFAFKDSITVLTANGSMPNQNFIAIKLGDVIYDWNNTIPKGIKQDKVIFNYSINKNTSSFIKMPVTLNNFNDVAALRYTLNFNNNLYEFVAIENNNLSFDFNNNKANATGNISMLWIDKNAEAKTFASGTNAFTIVLKKKNGNTNNDENILSINNEMTSSEAYNSASQKLNVSIEKTIEEVKTNAIAVYPNPTKNVLNVNFNASKNEVLKIEVVDVYGKKAMQLNKLVNAGNNNINCNIETLQSGIYFVNVINSNGTKSSSKFIKQ